MSAVRTVSPARLSDVSQLTEAGKPSREEVCALARSRTLAPAAERERRVRFFVQENLASAYSAALATRELTPTQRDVLLVLIGTASADGVSLSGPEFIRDRLPRKPRRPSRKAADEGLPTFDRRAAPRSEFLRIETINRALAYCAGKRVRVNGEWRTIERPLVRSHWVTRGRWYRGIRTSHGFRVFTLEIKAIEALGTSLAMDRSNALGTSLAMDRSLDRSISRVASSLSLSSPPALSSQAGGDLHARARATSPPPIHRPREDQPCAARLARDHVSETAPAPRADAKAGESKSPERGAAQPEGACEPGTPTPPVTRDEQVAWIRGLLAEAGIRL